MCVSAHLKVKRKVSSTSLTQSSVSVKIPYEDWALCVVKEGLEVRCEGGLNKGIRCTLWIPMARKHTDAETLAISSDDDLDVALPCGRRTTL
jgi:hypothetical protein